MAQLGKSISRYHKILESEPYRDLAWAEALNQRMQGLHLAVGGKPVCPFLRPHFISRKQHDTMVKVAETLLSAIERVKTLALGNQTLLNRMELLPGEKMLAMIDPGYPAGAVTSLLDTSIQNGHMHVLEYNPDAPTGVVYSEALADLFHEAPPMKEFRKKAKVTKIGGSKYLLDSLLKAYKAFGGPKHPSIAILEFKQPFRTAESGEFELLADQFRRQGYPTEIVSPDQLDYRAGVLRRGDYRIDLVYRKVKAQEFLVRFDLNHPLVRAYREGKACVVNSFRSEIAQKKALFDLLTDETITAGFPAVEKKVIREYIPWTRRVGAAKTTYKDEVVDLPEFILRNRERLVLKPNDDSSDQHPVRGWETDASAWERALRMASRNPYVVQEKVDQVASSFPVYNWGRVDMRDMQIGVHPHAFLGKIHGCSTWLTPAAGNFSSTSGIAPTFILEGR
ncbi:MAG: circularly permuted type 2 ATP-grasp protein [Acidobacteria bacterium]|nr:circularly permuted type 2 ATP-grasp protein [Acidobacteriota bacterium]